MSNGKTFLLPLLSATILISWAGSSRADDGTSLAGTWRGESKCAADAPACHDEQVVYFIAAIPGRPDQLSIRADKIVDGKAITMGSGPWNYDAKKQTLSFESNGRVWVLAIHGKQIVGTLKVGGNVVFRRMTLIQDPQ